MSRHLLYCLLEGTAAGLVAVAQTREAVKALGRQLDLEMKLQVVEAVLHLHVRELGGIPLVALTSARSMSARRGE